MVEYQKEDDEDSLVKELTPSLHEKSHRHFTATVKTVLFGRNTSRSSGVFHGSSCSHGILASNTDTVEEEGPGVTDDPAVQIDTPGCNEHEETTEHDECVLD